ncbi:MAG: hypothetical protein RLZZ215_2697 [Pseudomonadota bacterium]|jgi:hypothetical protein
MDVTSKAGVRGVSENNESNKSVNSDIKNEKNSKRFAAIMNIPMGLESLTQSQVQQVNKTSEFQSVAYREEGTAGHGNLVIEGDAKIQGYVADMPANFNLETQATEGQRCKKINEGQEKEAIVCIGSNNNIPPEGDVDFVAINDKWYKIRSGTAIVSQDPNTNETIIRPKGASIGTFGISPNLDWDPNKDWKNNLSDSGSVVHEVNNQSPFPWSSPSKSLEPVQYLNRLNTEQGLAPLPVTPPPAPDASI